MEEIGYNYITTVRESSITTFSHVGNFTSAYDRNLIICKNNHFDIHTFEKGELQSVKSVPLYGRIANIKFFHPANCVNDLLFIITEQKKICILQYNEMSSQIDTIATGSVYDSKSREIEHSTFGFISESKQVIGIHVYEGVLLILPYSCTSVKGKVDVSKMKNIKLNELLIKDILFLDGLNGEKNDEPIVCILYEEDEKMKLKCYHVCVKKGEMKEIIKIRKDEMHSYPLNIVAIPKPYGGFLIISQGCITYYNTDVKIRLNFTRDIVITANCKIDKNRWLFGDTFGKLYMLSFGLNNMENVILKMNLIELGMTTSVSSVSYLDSGIIFVGSHSGDSKLVKLLTEKTNGCFIEEVGEDFSNIGPIIDFDVIDTENQGQGIIVTCSGVGKFGSLRVLRCGVGIEEHSTIDIDAVITGLWTLKKDIKSNDDDYIVLSFLTETVALELDDDEINKVSIEGFEHESQTVFCGTLKNKKIVQVTTSKIILVDSEEQRAVWSENTENGKEISIADGNNSQLLVVIGDSLFFYQLEGKVLKKIRQKKFLSEIASVSINTFDNDEENEYCAVGFWDKSVVILDIPVFDEVYRIKENIVSLPRSVLFVTLEGANYLFCSLGNGQFLSYVVKNDGKLKGYKNLPLGNTSGKLKAFKVDGETNVFVASDRPTVIYSKHKQLGFSVVNTNDIGDVCPFNARDYTNCLVMNVEGSMMIGSVDEVQRVHIISIPLYEQPRKICYQQSTNSLIVLTINNEVTLNGILEKGLIRLFDSHSYEDKNVRYELRENEHGSSIILCKFANDDNEYVIVGSTIASREQVEPEDGKIMVFQIRNNNIVKITSVNVKGSVVALCSFNGKLLASVNSQVHLYNWVHVGDEYKLIEDENSRYVGHIFTITLQSKGNFIFLGDIMKSMNLLRYDSIEGKKNEIVLVACDYYPRDLMDSEMINEDTVICTDYYGNIFLLRRRDAMEESDKPENEGKLDVISRYHLGDTINVIKRGSLIMKDSTDESILKVKTYIYGTVSGAVGIMAQLPRDIFDFMKDVEKSMVSEIKGIGGFDHTEYRRYYTDKRTEESNNFIDGDMVECYMKLPIRRKENVLKFLQSLPNRNGKYSHLNCEKLERKIEELSRNIH